MFEIEEMQILCIVGQFHLLSKCVYISGNAKRLRTCVGGLSDPVEKDGGVGEGGTSRPRPAHQSPPKQRTLEGQI